MMMLIGDFLELRDVEHSGKLVKMKHRFVFAVFAEKSHVLAEIHILQMIRDKAAVAALDALAEFFDNFVGVYIFHRFKRQILAQNPTRAACKMLFDML